MIDFNPQTGNEIKNRRPGLVLSSWDYNRASMSLAVVCPITRTRRGGPFEVAIPAGIEVEGVILSDQLKNVDWLDRNTVFLCEMPDETVDKVLEKVGVLLQIL